MPEYDKMTRERARQKKADEANKRAASRRTGTDQFPPSGPEIEQANREMIAAAEREGKRLREHELAGFTNTGECQWCMTVTNVRVIPVEPAEYSSDGRRLLRASRSATVCASCLSGLGLLTANFKVLVKDRERSARATRAEQSAGARADQISLFDDNPLDPIQNG